MIVIIKIIMIKINLSTIYNIGLHHSHYNNNNNNTSFSSSSSSSNVNVNVNVNGSSTSTSGGNGGGVGIPQRPSSLSTNAVISSSLPSAAVSESVIRSDLTQVVQKLEKENALLRESLRKSEDQKMMIDIKSRQLETRYSKLESVLSLLHSSLREKERGKEREKTSEASAGEIGQDTQTPLENGDTKGKKKMSLQGTDAQVPISFKNIEK
jgi:hypothetical protein